MDNLPPVPQPVSSPKTKWWIVGGIFLGIIIIFFAFYLFRSTLFPSAPKVTQKQNPVPTPASQRANPLFDSQTATINGTITKIDGITVSVTNDKGISGDFPISSKVVIYSYNQNPPQATASSDMKTVEIGKKATLFLELINGEYQVISISYFSSLPTPKR